MTKSLIITEKPSVTRDITEAIGGFSEKNKGEYYESDEYVCTFAVGHILGLMAPEDIDPKYKRWRLADLPIVPEKFQLKPLEKQKSRVKLIEKLLQRKDIAHVINACDAAREGELIFREIIDYANISKPIKRLWLQSMTKTAIREGFAKLRRGEEYEGLAAAASCRSWSDWLIGMNATRALTVRLKSKSERGASWSAGRVQTPTLAILVKRELEVLSHEPIPYQKIEAVFKATDHEYNGTWFDRKFKKDDTNAERRDDRLFDKDLVARILQDVLHKEGLASEVRKQRPRKAPLLFDLTSLQRDANNRFGWPAARTLKAAQRCYETHKVLTYPRTSSRALPNDYIKVVDELLSSLSGHADYGRFAAFLLKKGRENEKKIFDDSGVSDHFAIIPTGEIRPLEGDDRKLFDLVMRQFLAAFFPVAVYEEVVRTTVVGEHYFRSKPPMVLKEPGWLAVFEKEREERVSFPPLIKGKDEVEGIKVKNEKIEALDFFTKPPPRISEAGLLGLMENAGRQVDDEELSQALQKAEGLGTAATRADIIEGLKTREYVDRSLRPTVKGIRLIDVLQRINAQTITSAELTGKMELHLAEVEQGSRNTEQFMDEVKQVTIEVIDAAKGFDFESIYPDIDPLGKCPKCGDEVYERAWFYGCKESTKRSEGPKKCDFLIWKDNYGRYIDRRSVRLLLEKGTTGELDGFRSQSGKTYKAILSLENGQLVRKSVAGEEADDSLLDKTFEVNPAPLGRCPLEDHKDLNCEIVETRGEFICTTKKKEKEAGQAGKGFSFPRFVCKREMKREEILGIMRDKETPFLTGFISKRGRPFSAKLKLQEKGGFTFEFPERAPKSKAKKQDEQSQDSITAGSPGVSSDLKL